MSFQNKKIITIFNGMYRALYFDQNLFHYSVSSPLPLPSPRHLASRGHHHIILAALWKIKDSLKDPHRSQDKKSKIS